MSAAPTPDDDKQQQSADNIARDRFAALGQFVEKFEQVVSILRFECARMVMGERRGVTISEGANPLAHQTICELPFHHVSIAAQTLLQIWRGLFAETIRYDKRLDNKDKALIKCLLSTAEKEFSKVIKRRNILLHTTWRIARDDGDEMPFAEKFKVNADGLIKIDVTPRSVEDLIIYTKMCNCSFNFIGRLCQIYIYTPRDLPKWFIQNEDKKWVVLQNPLESAPPPSPERQRG
jgi:hypothetical protein